MKPNHEPDKDRALDKVLKQWVVDAPLPPRFEEQVWQRIARTEARPAPTFLASLSRLIEAALPQPRFACSYVAVLLVLGVMAGSWAAQRETSRLDAALGSRYVQSIDPYRKAPSEQ
ncbi:MAG TPA: hypothetical protein VG146_12560 [Verrucomicrobiae bacterium]|nr:hypothetical protein [Verrucomicrobiae bacterium]